MFMGEYTHNIDAKGRLSIPAKIRNQCQDSVIVTKGNEGCLSLYTLEGWQHYYEELQKLPKNRKEARLFLRMVTAKASECEFDKLGRINIPKPLRKEGSLVKSCVVIGAGDHVEIWDQEKWNNYYEDNVDSFDEISEGLDSFEY